MSPPNYRVRRATLDDIGELTALWRSMGFPADELARRITEFQVAEAEDGRPLGAVGLHITQQQGLIHSEAYRDFALAEQLRPLLWERLQSVATNHGLHRLWSREQAPFWNHCGLAKPDEEALAKLPGPWAAPPAAWLTLKLKDELAQVISADQEFALFMQQEKQRTERAFQQARALKAIATFIAFAVLALVIIGAFILFKKNPQLLHR
jgi:N-acetylglutamate synthase-like GNAT family acetyltransferase